MRPFVGLLSKDWRDCKCRHCKRKKPVRNKVRPKKTIRARLRNLLKKEMSE